MTGAIALLLILTGFAPSEITSGASDNLKGETE